MSRLLVMCECSQNVMSAFLREGVDAYSCDIKPCMGNYPDRHLQMDCFDAFDLIEPGFVIAHPPCTYLTSAGACNFSIQDSCWREEQAKAAVDFFMRILNLPVKYLVVENPTPIKRFGLPPYSQIINPCNFGEDFQKRTCLWIRGDLPPLMETVRTLDATPLLHYKPMNYYKNGNRSEARSIFSKKVAEAMAHQWSPYCGRDLLSHL